MKKTTNPALALAGLAMLLAAPVQAAKIGAIDFNGYLRSGAGASSKGGEQQCFQLAGAAAKYRLGNECETYGELAFGGEAYKLPGTETSFKIHTRLAFSVDQQQDYEVDDPAFRETWVEVDKVGTGALADARVWVGKRFYQRQDIHINDFYFWDNSGPGGGIENVDVGFGKFDYAYRSNGGDVTVTTGTRNEFYLDPDDGLVKQRTVDVTRSFRSDITGHDFRLHIPTNPGGTLTLGVDLRFTRNSDEAKRAGLEDSDGQMFNILHTQGGVWGGFNKFGLQYGKGVVANLAPAYPSFSANENDKTFRVIEALYIEPKGSGWSAMGTIIYEDKDKQQKWLSAGVRPQYDFDDRWGVAVEYGYDRVKPESGDTRTLNKLTVAGLLTAGHGVFARPQLRAFWTYAKWNEAAQEAASAGSTLSSTGLFGDSRSGNTYGLQMEAWW